MYDTNSKFILFVRVRFSIWLAGMTADRKKGEISSYFQLVVNEELIHPPCTLSAQLGFNCQQSLLSWHNGLPALVLTLRAWEAVRVAHTRHGCTRHGC